MKNTRLMVLFVVIFIGMSELYPLLIKSDETVTASLIDGKAYYAYHSRYNRAEFIDIFQKDSRLTSVAQNLLRNNGETAQNSQSSIKGSMDSPWPMMSHDVYHTGRSQYNTAQPPEGVEIWRFGASMNFDGGVIVDKQGIVFFGGDDSYFYAVYPNATLKWKTFLTDPSGYYGVCIESTPAIDENAILYVGSLLGPDGNYFYAINSSNGVVKWHYPTGNNIDSSPAIGSDGTIFFGDWSGYVHALHPDGTVKWKYHTGDVITGSPAIGPDGAVYIGSHDNSLYAFNPDNGTVKWKFVTGGWVRVSPCVGDDGTVYCVSFDGYLYAIYPNNGTMKWRTFVNAGTNPTIGPDGTIYAGWDILYAVNPDGSVKWTFSGYGAIEGGTPCTSREGIIYFGTITDWLIALNPNGTLRWQHDITGVCESPPAIDSNGWIYIGSESPGAAIHAFGQGPLRAEANGPYEGITSLPIQLTGDVFGGSPPYVFKWEFGDNQTSTEQNPKHTYAQHGNYTVIFTVIDNNGNQSIDTAAAAIDFAPPSVTITKPINAIYFMDTKIKSFKLPLIFGPITIEVDARQEHYGVHEVSFFIDDKELKTDLTYPYSCVWLVPSFRKHTITIQAEDNSQKLNWASIEVWKFL